MRASENNAETEQRETLQSGIHSTIPGVGGRGKEREAQYGIVG